MAKKTKKQKIPSQIGGVKTNKEGANPELLKQLKSKGKTVSLEDLSPEELHQLQLEQAIRESNDPTSRLQKLHNPLSLRNFFWSLVIFAVLTIIVAYIIIYFQVDRFDFWLITKDLLDKSGISSTYAKVRDWILDFFTNPEGEEAARIFLSKL